MYKKIGFIVPHTERSHLAYKLIKNINQLVLHNNTISPSIFTEEITRLCILPSCPIMNMLDIWGYDGAVVATNFSSVQTLLNSPGPSKKIFYVWDLEWLRLTQFGIIYSDLYNLFNNPQLTIIPRCENHKKIINNNFNCPTCDPVDDINIEKMLLC